jgi:hypothetical protein
MIDKCSEIRTKLQLLLKKVPQKFAGTKIFPTFATLI